MPIPAVPHRHLISRLQLEWDRMARSPAALRRASGWGLFLGELHSLDDVLDRAGFARRSSAHRCDADADASNRVLGDLVVIARNDELAARIVLQRILPGLANRARRRAHSHAGRIDVFDELLSCAWHVIRAFPVERRPTHVASNLLRDAEYHAFVRPTRRRLSVHPVPDDQLDRAAFDHVDPRAELRELLDDARRAGIPDGDLRLVAALAAGVTTAQLATQWEVTDRTVRNHRARVLRELRRIALAA